jgi:hypothetical protein
LQLKLGFLLPPLGDELSILDNEEEEEKVVVDQENDGLAEAERLLNGGEEASPNFKRIHRKKFFGLWVHLFISFKSYK